MNNKKIAIILLTISFILWVFVMYGVSMPKCNVIEDKLKTTSVKRYIIEKNKETDDKDKEVLIDRIYIKNKNTEIKVRYRVVNTEGEYKEKILDKVLIDSIQNDEMKKDLIEYDKLDTFVSLLEIIIFVIIMLFLFSIFVLLDDF